MSWVLVSEMTPVQDMATSMIVTANTVVRAIVTSAGSFARKESMSLSYQERDHCSHAKPRGSRYVNSNQRDWRMALDKRTDAAVASIDLSFQNLVIASCTDPIMSPERAIAKLGS